MPRCFEAGHELTTHGARGARDQYTHAPQGKRSSRAGNMAV
ncbi:hypothetical protein BN2537_3937 [Streptomyces venezuelae]|nr:hypothetical protein BN2537_3937 [Streptomyces venezuelae]